MVTRARRDLAACIAEGIAEGVLIPVPISDPRGRLQGIFLHIAVGPLDEPGEASGLSGAKWHPGT